MVAEISPFSPLEQAGGWTIVLTENTVFML
jgi:hypothetical protein